MRYVTLASDSFGRYVVVIFNHLPSVEEEDAILEDFDLGEDGEIVGTVETGELTDEATHVIEFDEKPDWEV